MGRGLQHSPDLSVGGGGLGDDGAGLGRGQGLLDHNAAVVVSHPGVRLLVLAWLAMQGNVLDGGQRETGQPSDHHMLNCQSLECY